MPPTETSEPSGEGPSEDHPNGDTSWRRAAPVLWRRSLGGVILALVDDESQPTALTSTGRAVWDLLERPLRVERIVDVLSAGYRADPEVVEKDVMVLLEELARRGFVVREPGEAEVGR